MKSGRISRECKLHPLALNPEMESKSMEKNMEAMDIDLVNDGLNSSKRVRRSLADNYSVEYSSREDDSVEDIDISSTELGMRNDHRGKFVSNQSWKTRSSIFTSNSVENGYSIMDQKRVGNVNGNNKVIISPNGGKCFPFRRSDMRGKGKEIESMSNHRQNFISNQSYRASSGIDTGQAKSISKDNFGRRVYMNLSEGGSSHQLNPNNAHADRKNKRKVNLDNETIKNMQLGEHSNLSTRATSLFRKEGVCIAEEQGSPCRFDQNFGWQKAHNINLNTNQLSHAYPRNRKEKLSSLRHEIEIEDQDHRHIICQSSQTISIPFYDQSFPDPVLSRRNHSWKKYSKGKKCNSLPSLGETSVLFLNQSSYPQSHVETSNSDHDPTLMEIDKLCPDARCYSSNGQHDEASDSSVARASQIESDEAFARKLQEQFYHETTRFIDMEKLDKTIAWSLQQHEDAKATALSWSGHSNSELYEIRSNFDDEVDLDTRLDFLDDLLENNALQDDDTTSSDSLNDTNPEMLSNVDACNHHHFGSSEINDLPLSLIQNDNNNEACAICLEIPSIGETMRHLPCLHKFHKMCIDIWLKKKPSCPVCKNNIT